jgi:pteridine reductase
MRRRALITGAGKRVGRAIALELAEHDIDICVHYRSSEEAAEEVAQACRAAGVEAFTARADLADADQTRALVEAVRERWDTLSLLVNNASLFASDSLEETSLEELRKLQAVHVEAPFLLVQGLVDRLRAAAEADPGLESSLVVNLEDISLERPFKGFVAYSLSKAGLAMLTKVLGNELAPAVRAVGVAPGHVAWPPDYSEEDRKRYLRRIPMSRVGSPDEAARLVRFLLLEGTYINGDTVKIDGGLANRY